MIKTLRISFSLRNTYRVNGILYSIRQIPLIGKLVPQSLYGVRGLKIAANVLSILWEIVSGFGGKLLYFLLMLVGPCVLYRMEANDRLFLHILVFLTIIGAFVNTYMFNPSRDKYYALILMRMNAREYTLIHYGYAILKVLAGFLLFGLLFGLKAGVPWWQCILIPLFVAGLKLSVAAYALWDYERTNIATNENKLGKLQWIATFLLLAAAYGLPALHIMLPEPVVVIFMILSGLAGCVSVVKIWRFNEYYEVYHQILIQSMNDMETASQVVQDESRKAILEDTSISSRRRGFEYLNELFIRRHQKILWKSSKRIAMVCLCLIAAALLALYLAPESKPKVNQLILTSLPYFVFIMYLLNRGTGFTRALFMNCDHSLLTYSFYKQPSFVLKLFRIRMREIIKVNLLPALVIGAGLALVLFVSGGTDQPINYGILLVSVMGMSVFFSVHYLTIYYLLQPYNAGTEMKSGTYRVILSATYLVCFFMMELKMPTLVFGCMTIVFCVIYCAAACVLVYKLAPKTFRLRN